MGLRLFRNDKTIKIKGFRSGENFEVENRTLGCDILIREIYCTKCEDKEEIRFHTKDIPKLIRALNKLMKLQK